MPVINVDTASTVPPFEQVRSQIAAQIQSGSLPVGAKLPTVRGLATQLGLAANTVARAFGELEHAGLVRTRGRAGTTVSGSGDEGRERVAAAASDYASIARSLGVRDTEAHAILQAVFDGR